MGATRLSFRCTCATSTPQYCHRYSCSTIDGILHYLSPLSQCEPAFGTHTSGIITVVDLAKTTLHIKTNAWPLWPHHLFPSLWVIHTEYERFAFCVKVMQAGVRDVQLVIIKSSSRPRASGLSQNKSKPCKPTK